MAGYLATIAGSLWEIKGFFPSVKDLPEIPVRMQTWSKMPESSAKELCQI